MVVIFPNQWCLIRLCMIFLQSASCEYAELSAFPTQCPKFIQIEVWISSRIIITFSKSYSYIRRSFEFYSQKNPFWRKLLWRLEKKYLCGKWKQSRLLLFQGLKLTIYITKVLKKLIYRTDIDTFAVVFENSFLRDLRQIVFWPTIALEFLYFMPNSIVFPVILISKISLYRTAADNNLTPPDSSSQLFWSISQRTRHRNFFKKLTYLFFATA